MNGKQVGKTPFSGSVPLCAVIEVGKDREKVDVELEHNGRVEYMVENKNATSSGTWANTASYVNESYKSNGNSFTDNRDGKKYKTVTIGTQTWMAENLNYNTNGSKCYNNDPSYCSKYGRLYNWNTAMKACPAGWHLPTKDEYGKLDDFVGGAKTAGIFLKATNGWNSNGNGTDTYGFSALPGGSGKADGSFDSVGDGGRWWSSTEGPSASAYYGRMGYNYEYMFHFYNNKFLLFSVRCVKD